MSANNMNSTTKKHTLHLDNRTELTVTSVDEVISFDEESVVLSVSDTILNVSGTDLSVRKLNLADGEVIISGLIDAIIYIDQVKKRSIFDKFKKQG